MRARSHTLLSQRIHDWITFGTYSTILRQAFPIYRNNCWQIFTGTPGIELAVCVDQRPAKNNEVTLGFVEGLKNKIREIQRRADGHRDEEYLRLKFLTVSSPRT